ncbi:MAG: 3-hydroxyacyl-CoA dehydrogenase [Hyperthermus sp.]|nr:MAG: 3-hydroxyacyl-CoA dehydrogenase [Hyperthermus sp.]
MREVKTVLVVGAGTMGHGIAEVAALAGYTVYLADISSDILRGALEKIRWSLGKLYSKGAVREPPDRVMERIHTVVNLSPSGDFTSGFREVLGSVDFVIEAVPEKLELKQRLFEFMDSHTAGDVVLATNTSSLPITEIASATKLPERVVGMHFFNPPPLMPLVEVIRGEATSDDTVDATVKLARSMGKEPVIVKRDVPGFIVNRVLARILNEACWTVARGEASVIEVDSAVKYRLGFPMGLFELADYSGIDVFYYVFDAMTRRGFKAHPCPLFREKFEAGLLGVKAGRGFYEYPGPGRHVRPSIPKEAGSKLNPVYLIAPGVNEAAYLVREGIAERDDVDKATRLGLGLPKGILRYADEYGVDTIVDALRKLHEKTGWEEYAPDPLLESMVREGRLGVKAGRGFYEYSGVEERRYDTLLVRLEPPLAWIVLNRPERLNAISPRMLDELTRVLDELEDDDRVRVVLVTGAGRAFSAGADVSEFTSLTPVKAMVYSRRFQEVLFKLEYYTRPVIAVLNGYTLGGGLELAMAADFRIASEGAMLGQPEINLGIIPGAGGTQRLPRLIGRSRAKELIYTGDMIPAKEAEALGLVDRVVPAGQLEQEARQFALKLAEKPPLALMAAKYSIQAGVEASIWSGMMLESSLFGLLFSTKDAAEGVSAFLEKRRPRFRGV